MSRPQSLAEVASRRASHASEPLWKPLGEFLDTFYAAAATDRAAMLAVEPPKTIPSEEGAYLAAAADYLSALYGLAPPAWIEAPERFLDVAYWPEKRGAALEAICLAESPTAFRRRFIFTEGLPLRRKAGPRPAIGAQSIEASTRSGGR